MRCRKLSYTILCLFLVGCAAQSHKSRGTILIEGIVISQESTGWNADCGEDCIVWAVPFVYEIEVGRVLAGSVEMPTIKAAKIMHSGLNTDIEMPWLFVLRPTSDLDKPAGSDAEYWLEDVAMPQTISCFNESIDHLRFNGDVDAEEVEGLRKGLYGEYCFFTETLQQIDDGT
jgi:hypothetical protein